MANHGPSYGLDADLAAKRAASFDSKLESEAVAWIEAVTGQTNLGTGDTLAASLKDGVIICEFANKIKPNAVSKINKGKMPFTQMENIGNYLKFAQSLGVKPSDMFQTVDLFENKNMNQVVNHFHALGRAVQKLPGYNGPTIGVKESEKHVVDFTDEQLNAGQAQLGLLQTGQQKGAVSHVDRSTDVLKTHKQGW